MYTLAVIFPLFCVEKRLGYLQPVYAGFFFKSLLLKKKKKISQVGNVCNTFLLSPIFFLVLSSLFHTDRTTNPTRSKNPAATMPAGNDLQDWFKSLPVFTRYWFGGTILFTLLGRFGLLSPYWLILAWEPFIRNFNLWRPVSALFYYPLTPQTGFHFLINLYFLYNYSLRLETGIFDGRPADYLFMLLFNWTCSVIVALMMSIPYLMDPMVSRFILECMYVHTYE